MRLDIATVQALAQVLIFDLGLEFRGHQFTIAVLKVVDGIYRDGRGSAWDIAVRLLLLCLRRCGPFLLPLF